MPDGASTAQRWRWLVPVVALAAGVLFAVSAHDSGGTDLRPASITNLADTVRAAEQRVHVAGARVQALQARVDRTARAAGRADSAVARAQRAVTPLKAPAGLTAVHGAGLDGLARTGRPGGSVRRGQPARRARRFVPLAPRPGHLRTGPDTLRTRARTRSGQGRDMLPAGPDTTKPVSPAGGLTGFGRRGGAVRGQPRYSASISSA